MKYDSKQLAIELGALHHNKELAFQQYHKICGAVDMLEAMQKNVLAEEKEAEAKKTEEEKVELEPVPESAAA